MSTSNTYPGHSYQAYVGVLSGDSMVQYVKADSTHAGSPGSIPAAGRKTW